MATDLERLVVQLSADIKGYENALNRAQGQTSRRLNAIQRQASTSGRSVAASLARSAAQIGAAFVFSGAVRELASLSDAATRVDNSLKVVGVTGAELERVYAALAKSAMANGAPIESLATLFGRASLAQKELGVSTDQLLSFTNNVATALRVAGTDAQTASGALLQLGQALGSGRVMAEEFNSILEGTPTIARAVAAGLKEAGGSVSQLKSLVVDGKVSSEAFFQAFQAGSVVLEGQASKATFTIAQATTNLSNALINVAREFNNSTGASERFAGGLNNAASAISNFDVSVLIQKIQELNKGFEDYLANLKVFESLNQITGITDANGQAINVDKSKAEADIASLEKELKTLQERIAVNTDLGFDNTEALARIAEVTASLSKLKAEAANMPDTVPGYRLGENGIEAIPESSQTNGQMGGSKIRGGARRRAVQPVSIADFKPPPGSKTGNSSTKSSRTRADEYAREVEQINKRTTALQAETAAQAGLNPLLNDYGYTLEFARAKQDLLTAAQEAGVKITPELTASIDNLAAGYANAVVASEQLAEKQDEIRQRAEEAMATAKDVTRGIIDGFIEGASAADILADSLKKIGSALLDDVLNSIFKINNAGGGGGGFLSGLFSLFGGGASRYSGLSGGLFAEGGYTGDGGKYQPAGVVHKGEYIFDKAAVKAAGGPAALEAMRRNLKGYANGGAVGVSVPTIPSLRPANDNAVKVNYAPVIDARGADAAAVARLEKVVAKQGAEMQGRVEAAVRSAQKRNVKLG